MRPGVVDVEADESIGALLELCGESVVAGVDVADDLRDGVEGRVGIVVDVAAGGRAGLRLVGVHLYRDDGVAGDGAAAAGGRGRDGVVEGV